MAVKRRASSSPLSSPPQIKSGKRKLKLKVQPGPTDEFQQVTLASFVDRFQIKGMGSGGEVFYQPDDLIPGVSLAKYVNDIGSDPPPDQPMLKMYGRTFPQSRSIAAYSTTSDATLSYSGSNIAMHHPFPPIIDKMRAKLENDLGVKFNHVMLNRYDDGSVYIGRHSDNLNNLVIASISLGAERTFIMSPRVPSRAKKGGAGKDLEEELKGRKNVKWILANGSLVVMQGRTQEFWKHEIPKEASIKKGRISLTFRQLV
ncbi:MAG: hypothetical protein TREMPRED_003460 [Tremellales sp. Tagirdzhanova-0007]|nr:MAG: hypothetical protein TREMPRED_003460 [Tremellales sp. Tagirdzhanova-0007]